MSTHRGSPNSPKSQSVSRMPSTSKPLAAAEVDGCSMPQTSYCHQHGRNLFGNLCPTALPWAESKVPLGAPGLMSIYADLLNAVESLVHRVPVAIHPSNSRRWSKVRHPVVANIGRRPTRCPTGQGKPRNRALENAKGPDKIEAPPQVRFLGRQESGALALF